MIILIILLGLLCGALIAIYHVAVFIMPYVGLAPELLTDWFGTIHWGELGMNALILITLLILNGLLMSKLANMKWLRKINAAPPDDKF